MTRKLFKPITAFYRDISFKHNNMYAYTPSNMISTMVCNTEPNYYCHNKKFTILNRNDGVTDDNVNNINGSINNSNNNNNNNYNDNNNNNNEYNSSILRYAECRVATIMRQTMANNNNNNNNNNNCSILCIPKDKGGYLPDRNGCFNKLESQNIQKNYFNSIENTNWRWQVSTISITQTPPIYTTVTVKKKYKYYKTNTKPKETTTTTTTGLSTNSAIINASTTIGTTEIDTGVNTETENVNVNTTTVTLLTGYN